MNYARNAAELSHFVAALKTAKWNAVIARRAVRVVETGSSIKYLHPTKGWRYVNPKRLKVYA